MSSLINFVRSFLVAVSGKENGVDGTAILQLLKKKSVSLSRQLHLTRLFIVSEECSLNVNFLWHLSHCVSTWVLTVFRVQILNDIQFKILKSLRMRNSFLDIPGEYEKWRRVLPWWTGSFFLTQMEVQWILCNFKLILYEKVSSFIDNVHWVRLPFS